MAHELLRLYEKVVSQPQMMEVAAFDRVASLLEDRNSGLYQAAIENKALGTSRQVTYSEDTKTGIVDLSGPLTNHHYVGMCGETPTSYQGLVADFKTLLDAGATTIVLDTDSPGGEAYGVFETARQLRKMADEKGARILTYVDGMAASAAYALASVSDEIIMNPQAEVGSIGVVVKLRNANKAMKNMGVEDTYVYAGDSKIPFDAEGGFAESFLQDLQGKVDKLYGDFISHVAQMRGMDASAVQGTQAKTFMVEDALKLGLADKVMEVEEFYTYLSTVANGDSSMSLPKRFSLFNQGDSAKMQELETLQAALAETSAQFDAYKLEAEAKLAGYEALAAELTATKQELSTLQAHVDAVTALAETARLEAEAQAKQMKEDARRAKLSSLVTADEVEGLMATLNVLDDAAFELVAATLETKAKAVEQSNLFAEMGVADHGDADKLSDTAKHLQAKYSK